MTDSARPRPSAAPLPIDAHLSRVVEAVERAGVAIVSAEPGAGKTTRVPVALLDAAKAGSVLVLEPRRIAARYSAERVAYERGSKLGDEVGFLTRFERAASGRTRLMFLTEGILSRRMLADPRLEGVSTVVLDEFHERHLPSDIGLALLARLRQTTRPDLRVVVMSATLDVEPLARFLAAPVVSSTGRAYPVSVEHAPRTDDRPLESRVASALFDLIGRGLDGHVLVFLPGAREIRACMQTAGKLAEKHDLELLPLHGALGPAEQNRALVPSARRKVVFATNVAETSVTIDGVAAVVDSGLANVASCSPWSGLPILKLAKISKASAIQRAGRAGRTGPGTAIRLYTQGDFEARPAFEAPEIARADLSEAVLELVAQGIADPRALAWLEAPPTAALDRASTLLDMLGAVTRAPDGALALTADGERMIHFNVHPRQARIVVEAERRGVAFEGAALAAVAQEQPSRRADPREHRTSERSDLFFMMDELERVMSGGSGRDGRGASRELMAAAKVRDQLRAALGRDKGARAAPRPPTPDAFDDALLISVLAGYPDRVGRVKRPDLRVGRKAAEVVFAAGGSALLDDASAVREAELIVAIDVEDRVSGAQSKTSVRVASEVKPDFLLELFLDRIEDEEVVTIAGEQGRVQATRVLRYQNLVLEEHPAKAPSPELAARALARAALSKGLPLEAKEAIERLRVRIDLVRASTPAFGAVPFDPDDLTDVVARAAASAASLSELLATDFAAALLSTLSGEQQQSLRTLTPEKISLPSGRAVTVRYALASPPSIASRLQDFFGMTKGPTILGGRRPLTLELLAPNQRAVQTTTDLAGFWKTHYPAIARELRRKYPRHAWPDDPLSAAPPAPRGPRERAS